MSCGNSSNQSVVVLASKFTKRCCVGAAADTEMKDVRDASAILEPEPHLVYGNGFIDIETGHDDLFPEWWQKATNEK